MRYVYAVLWALMLIAMIGAAVLVWVAFIRIVSAYA
jgi:hypothetical protein